MDSFQNSVTNLYQELTKLNYNKIKRNKYKQSYKTCVRNSLITPELLNW